MQQSRLLNDEYIYISHWNIQRYTYSIAAIDFSSPIKMPWGVLTTDALTAAILIK